MPNLVFDTPTPPSQLYSTSTAQAVATSLKPRLAQAGQPLATSTVLPKSKLRDQYRPDMDFDLDGSSSSDSTFSSADLVENNNPKHATTHGDYYNTGGRHGVTDENRPPLDNYHKSPGYGDASMGNGALGRGDKLRFLDTQKSAAFRAAGSPARGRDRLMTRVDEHSDTASEASPHYSTASDSEDDWLTRGKSPNRPNNEALHSNARNVTSTPYPGIGQHSNNVSKSAFDGMARELRKEFERIMQAGQPATSVLPKRRNSPDKSLAYAPSPNDLPAAELPPLAAISPSYRSYRDAPLPRGVAPKSALSSHRAREDRELQRTPTIQRSYTGLPATTGARSSPPVGNIYEQRRAWPQLRQQQYTPLVSATSKSQGLPPGTIAPNNTKASTNSQVPPFHLAGKTQSRAYSPQSAVHVPDVTGLTDGLLSPTRVQSGPSSHRAFSSTANISANDGRREDVALTSALARLKCRLDELERENIQSEAKIAELQRRLVDRGTFHPADGLQASPSPTHDLAEKLRAEVAELHSRLNEHHRAMTDIQNGHKNMAGIPFAIGPGNSQWERTVTALGEALSHLADRITDVRTVLEELLRSLPNAHFPDSQGVPAAHPSAMPGMRELTPSGGNTHYQESGKSPTSNNLLLADSRCTPRSQLRHVSGIDTRPIAHHIPRAQASHNAEPDTRTVNDPLLDRAERILSTVPAKVREHTDVCELCRRQFERPADGARFEQLAAPLFEHRSSPGHQTGQAGRDALPAQTVVVRMLRKLEEEFDVHKRIYIELSEEYKHTDAATPNVTRRKLLANHLRDSIDVLEMKADEIKRLYDMLHCQGDVQLRAPMYTGLERIASNLRTRYSAAMA